MWYILVSVIAAAGIILGFTSCFSGNSVKDQPIDQSLNPSDSIKKQLTRAELLAKMAELANKKVPDELSQGAMCYKVAAPPSRMEYVCPVCGEKTLYTDDAGYFLNRNLSECRSIANTLIEVNCKLDESQFCKHCTPDLKETPQLCITTQLKGEETVTKFCGVDREEMQILQEFFNGKVVHTGDTGYETPLKEELDEIARMLGIEIK
jgi:hypothetical protein